MHIRRSELEKPWSAWGDRLTSLVIVGTTIALAGAWTLQYYSADGNARLIERISYRVVDPTWMPPGSFRPEALLGLHFFGDLPMLLGYGISENPYIISGMPAAVPPIAIYVFRLLGILGPSAALIALVILSLALIPIGVWHLMGGLSPSRRIIQICILVFLTLPMIVALDRGGLQMLAFGLVAVSLLFYQRQRPWLALIFLLLAISVKTYLLVLLLYPFLRGHRRFALVTAGAFLSVNAVLVLTFPGSPAVSFGGFLTSNLYFTSREMILFGSSLSGLILKAIALFNGGDVAIDFLSEYGLLLNIASLMWLLFVVILVLRREIPFWASFTLLLASAPMILGASQLYGLGWASVAAFYFAARHSDPFPFVDDQTWWTKIRGDSQTYSRTVENAMRVFVLVVIAASLVPVFWTVTVDESYTFSVASILAPAAILIGTIAVGGLGLLNRLINRRSRLTV